VGSAESREAVVAKEVYRFTLAAEVRETYADALRALQSAAVPFAVGGAFAVYHYTGIWRDTPDLDLFLLAGDVERALAALHAAGLRGRVEDRGWLAHAVRGAAAIDLIFGHGNYLAQFDDAVLARVEMGVVVGLAAPVVAIEELIWSKAYVAARDRFDGSDIAHLILKQGARIDWAHLIWRFGDHWDLLFTHLLLFRYSYPHDRDLVPQDVFVRLLERERRRRAAEPPHENVCRGSLLDHQCFEVDYERGAIDPREESARALGLSTGSRQRDKAA
jgi:hypothetical protein